MKYLVYFCLLLLLVASGCSPRANKATHSPVMQGNFSFYPDSNVLVYRKPGADTSVFNPLYIQLPQGITRYTMSDNSFVIHYAHQQEIIINLDLSGKTFYTDTSYTPQAKEISAYVKGGKLNTHRRQYIIKKGIATILLYNIQRKNFDAFNSELQKLKVL
jgi:hypothetical protein